MRSTLASLILAATMSVVGTAMAECVYPEAPDAIPDGNTASQDEMVAAMKSLKDYDAAVNAYLSCLEMETQARIEEGGDDLTEDQVNQIRAIQVKKHNAAVEALETRATQFNEQVRAFKAKQKS
jgi:fumarate hydratase class II